MTKKEVYAKHGIEYRDGKINAPRFGFIPELLINGNAKLGKGVYTYSTLAGTREYNAVVNGIAFVERGTCLCSCEGCYAQRGFFNMNSTVNALALRTWLARNALDFMTRAIIAQIEADAVKLVRIHASGDFFAADYTDAWREIAAACEGTAFWTYTKNPDAELSFDATPNVNVVASLILGCGYNFGHCDYIIDTYKKLTAAGESVHICRCGIDDAQHCNNCKGCSVNKYVLFIEHSTAYKAEKDPAFPTLREMIEKQARV